jgi:PAS domain S-box-containing protein
MASRSRLGRLGAFGFWMVVLSAIGYQGWIPASPVPSFWPAAGMATAYLLTSPGREWPYLALVSFIASWAADWITPGPPHPGLVVRGIEPLVGAYLIRRFADSDQFVPTLRYWTRSLVCGPGVSAALAAAVGTAVLELPSSDREFWPFFFEWWLADGLGQLIATPATLSFYAAWRKPGGLRWSSVSHAERVVFASLYFPLVAMMYFVPASSDRFAATLQHAVTPLLIWSALRLAWWVSFNALFLVSTVASWQVAKDLGSVIALGQLDWERTLGFQIPVFATAVGVQSIVVLAVERRSSSRAIARGEERFRNIVEATNEWMWEVAETGRLVYTSPHCRVLLGYEPSELLGKEPLSIVADEDSERVRQIIRERIARAEPIFDLLHRIRRKSGEHVWVESNAVPIEDVEGKVVGCRGATRDVSERIRADAEAARRREESARSEKLIALGTVVSGVAHEINNPSQFIVLNLPFVRRAWQEVAPALDHWADAHPDWRVSGLPIAEARREVADAIEEIILGSNRIAAIASDLRDFLHGSPERVHDRVDLNRVVESACALLVEAPELERRRVRFDLAQAAPEVMGSRSQLEQVLTNLILNAAAATEGHGGTISIRTWVDAESKTGRVEVTDDGVGIREEDLTRVTDPFFTTRRGQGGTGLGLAIAHRIVRDHAGRLEIESKVGLGTTVRFALPLAQ